MATDAPTKRERTLARLIETGLELFERQGYDETTVAQIARTAGVTEMTFFRHFPSKESLLLDDPYDPLLVAAIGRQPIDLPPFLRAVRGIREAWRAVPDPDQPMIRRRVRIAATTPSLRGATWRSTGNTEHAIVGRLVADGASDHDARIAASAVLAALVAGLFAWAEDETAGLATSIERALDVVDVECVVHEADAAEPAEARDA
ncbi:TetR/AcrR family transcriptional regulator [Agromyces sp. SYSU K20354]|uniref:TetR/AcrR family transcriptional regulator n=1 Tax=Agromyces cavernae TaxID=2898659 RepID=UPI001E31DEDC|nr:TetR/AcrR family transcriptional regulator [Agromyces cavernae]MCD2443166.1 TetR/AcrR family transcriptional regulator [Agromyces cavernae]